MNKLWQTRAKKYQKMLMRYLKYVLNDHLVLAVLFLIGGLALAYSSWLRQLTPQTWYIKPIVLSITALLTLVGQPILLLEDPDTVFLLAWEKDISVYLKHSIKRTLASASLPLIAVGVVIFPLLSLEYHDQIVNIAILGITLLGCFSQILRKYQRLYFGTFEQNLITGFILNVIILGLAIWWNTIIASILMVLMLGYQGYATAQTLAKKSFYWQRALTLENQRIGRIYQFFSLFTNVKQVNIGIKRRRYADGVLKWLARTKNVIAHLAATMMIRSGNQGSLWMRLLLVGMVVEGYSSQIYLKLIVAMLVNYLSVIQLMDVYRPLHEHRLVQIYPISNIEIEQGLLSVLKRIIILNAIVLILAGVINPFSIENVGMLVISQLLISLILTKWTIPNYIKKIN